MQYGFTFDEQRNEDDFEVTTDVPVVVDSMSMQYLQGATINYREDLMGSNFSIDNPNAQTSCGCGSSFSPY
jgi:iron-sulfur cluster insertion protein